MSSATDQRYTIISSDTHAGGSHAQYREFLEKKYLDDFDAWRNKYKNPFKDLGDDRRLRNWDNEMRNGQQDADGIVGEVIFPNTVPPFFPSFVLFAAPPKPEEYEHRLAGVRAHNRWLEDFCGQFPERRAGIGQFFVNDIDDAIEDVKWIKEHGLRGGALLPSVPPGRDLAEAAEPPRLRPPLEGLRRPRGADQLPRRRRWSVVLPAPVVGAHPDHRARQLLPPPADLHVAVGRVRALPEAQVRDDRAGLRVDPGVPRADGRRVGAGEEARRDRRAALQARAHPPEVGDRVLPAERVARRELPRPGRRACREGTVGLDKFMWGSDYPHDEGTYPFSREALRQVFSDWSPADMQRILTDNVAKLYDFDVKALKPLADEFGPTQAELAQPLLELPEHPNEALLRARASAA